MKKLPVVLSLLVVLLFLGCNEPNTADYEILGVQSKIIVEMITAVNEKDPDRYVGGFAESVQVFVDSEMKIDGRENLRSNRARHFEHHPEVRSEIQHLVEIDDRVILHDKVWLNESDTDGQDIVEIFTFREGEVVKVDVIQPRSLFTR